jgi:molybdate transport system regulatory protein
MEVRSKIWLEVDGNAVFGSGRRALLESIDKLGSINRAAKDINISYRKALSYIQSMEKRLGSTIVERQAGGKNGGGAVLTKDAREFLDKYEKLESGINALLDLRFLEIFGNGKSNKQV